MSDHSEATYEVGFGKPPRRNQFRKGQSGNPKGRPRGSQNFSTILAKAGRERVTVTMNGRTRQITKFEASMLQLVNKAASGDLKAIRELLCWIKSLEDSEQTRPSPDVLQESDSTVMTSILERIRQSDDQAPNNLTDTVAEAVMGKES
jgi:hypothetical protein